MGGNLNTQIDLQALLAKSLADVPCGSQRGLWRVPIGQIRYAVHYTLKNGVLKIVHLRRSRCTASRKRSIAMRLRRLMKVEKPPAKILTNSGTQTLESKKTKGSQTLDATKNKGSQTDSTIIQEVKGSQTSEPTTIQETKGNQTSEPIMNQGTKASQIPESPNIQQAKASQTKVKLATSQVTQCSQTHRLEYRTVDLDTIDLILQFSSYQQTLELEQKSIGSQGQALNCNTVSTQVIPNTEDNCNQASPAICCVGIQTVRGDNCKAVQTTTNNRSLHTQTPTTTITDIEAEVQNAHMEIALNLIHNDFLSLTGLIKDEMMQTMNKLVELILIEVQALRLEADRPREGLATETPTTPMPSCEQIGDIDTLPVEEALCEHIGDTLPRVEDLSKKADKAKAKKSSALGNASGPGTKRGLSLTYTKGLAKASHGGIPRSGFPSSSCQEYSTQTDDLEEFESKVFFTGTDAFTQTEKKRSGWRKLV